MRFNSLSVWYSRFLYVANASSGQAFAIHVVLEIKKLSGNPCR